MNNLIPLSVPNLNGNELKYASVAIQEGWVSSGGAYIKQFEEQFAKYAKTEEAVACQSGTAALHLALLACRIGPNDLVIVPTLTFIAAVNPIRYMCADPVFMDCDDSLCLDPDKLKAYLEEECVHRDGILYDRVLNRPIKALIVVHVFGNGAAMEAIMQLARHYGIFVIEDATEAIGSFYTEGAYTGKMTGTIGDIGVYSFNGNKILTTGGGGMLVSNDAFKRMHARHLSTQAKTDEVYFVHDEIGYNYRMTNLQAAIGIAQLEQIETFIQSKRTNYELYQKLKIRLLPFSDKVRPNYWFYSFMSKNRDGLIAHLSQEQIQVRPIWKLNHLQKPYVDCRAYKVEKACAYYDAVVNLPCSSGLLSEEVRRVAAAINAFE